MTTDLCREVNKYIDFSCSSDISSGLRIPFKILSNSLFASKRNKLRDFGSTASFAKVECQTCSNYNAQRRIGSPRMVCIVCKDYKRCMLCVILDKSENECGAIKGGGINLRMEEEQKKIESQAPSRPKPRPQQRQIRIPKEKVLPNVPFLHTPPYKEMRRKKQKVKRITPPPKLFSPQSSSDIFISGKRKSSPQQKKHLHCNSCPCCTFACIQLLDKAYQDLRQSDKNSFEQKIQFENKEKELNVQITLRDQTIINLKRRKMGDVDKVANLENQLEFQKSKNYKYRNQIIALQKALRQVTRNAKDALGCS